MIDTRVRLLECPFEVRSELRDAANENGYRIGPEEAAGWLFFRSASAPGEIALAATSAKMAGPFFLSVEHSGAAQELKEERAAPHARGHAAAFAITTREALFEAVRAVYRFSKSLPTFPYEEFVRETAHLGDTEAERAQKVRIGQDRFRAALIEYWKGVCPLTGISNIELLRASHIIPWKDCENDQERLNVYNGLLLSSLWDAAFDSGLISFDDLGRVIKSPVIDQPAAEALQAEAVPALELTDQHRVRLAWHRCNRWQSE